MRILVSILLSLFSLVALAQTDSTIVRRSSLLGIGSVQHLDTYLSPQHYNGTELRLASQIERFRPNKQFNIFMINEGSISTSKPKSENMDELSAFYRFGWGYFKRWTQVAPNLRLDAGLTAEALAGVNYIVSSSNNPVQVNLSAALAPLVAGEYDFRFLRKNMMVRYQVRIPLIGVMFSPNYGQSYYEIFGVGNYDRNVCLTTPFNAPSIRHSLSLDIPFGNGCLRIGYLGDVIQSRVNGIKRHDYTHAAMIGWVSMFQTHKIRR